MSAARRHGTRGFSLIETVLAMMLASGVVIAAMSVVTSSLRAEQWARQRVEGERLASELLAEVCALDFEESGSVGSFGREGVRETAATARSGLDDIDDFNGWTESPPQNHDGTVRDDLAGWTCSVRVERVSVANPTGPAVTYDSRAKRITVTASWRGVPVAEQSALRTAAWDDARLSREGTLPPVGVSPSGAIVDVLDATWSLLGGVLGTVSSVTNAVGGLLNGLLGGG